MAGHSVGWWVESSVRLRAAKLAELMVDSMVEMKVQPRVVKLVAKKVDWKESHLVDMWVEKLVES